VWYCSISAVDAGDHGGDVVSIQESYSGSRVWGFWSKSATFQLAATEVRTLELSNHWRQFAHHWFGRYDRLYSFAPGGTETERWTRVIVAESRSVVLGRLNPRVTGITAPKALE
jgi:hypothetical protein